ncbi:GNAT family N-acetyltransferase [Streptomyces buecherae]|uniref:GNAT family N-acetyltransferase n=1 Tax=Streptomyces buecherae TaxID=2763006 RepID=UPI0037A54171
MKYSDYTSADAADIREMILDIYSAVHSSSGDPFRSRNRFSEFYDKWSAKPSWSCVVSFAAQGNPTGFAYGASFAPGGWWKGAERPDSVPQDAPTFALSELLVLEEWRKTGTSKQLHDIVVNSCGDALSTLCVDVAHPKVVRLYESWGYVKEGEQKPFEDSPTFAVMVKRLRP